MTVKIVDNTFISACVDEINCIDLLDLSSQYYDIHTTNEVFGETQDGFNDEVISNVYDLIKISSCSSDTYIDLKNWLERRYPGLHTGEITTFLLALLTFAVCGTEYYYITDDNYMKKIIKNLGNDSIFIQKLDLAVNMENFNVTGTVGFTKRLIDKGVIHNQFVEPIIQDMEDNGFYLTDKVKDHLRGI